MEGILKRRREFQDKWAASIEQHPWIGNITKEEVEKHSDKDDCWVIINGEVYDITQYLCCHPGGQGFFMGKRDISQSFNRFHKGMDISFLDKLKIGVLVNP